MIVQSSRNILYSYLFFKRNWIRPNRKFHVRCYNSSTPSFQVWKYLTRVDESVCPNSQSLHKILPFYLPYMTHEKWYIIIPRIMMITEEIILHLFIIYLINFVIYISKTKYIFHILFYLTINIFLEIYFYILLLFLTYKYIRFYRKIV